MLHAFLVVENLPVEVASIPAHQNVANVKDDDHQGFLATGSEGGISIGSRSRASQVGTERIALGAAYPVLIGCAATQLRCETPVLVQPLRRSWTGGLGGPGVARRWKRSRPPRHDSSLVRQPRTPWRQPRSRDFQITPSRSCSTSSGRRYSRLDGLPASRS